MAGYHVFAASEVLTAANLNGYVAEQAIIAVASTGSITGSLHEGMVCANTTDNRIYVYDGAQWVRTQLAWSGVGGSTAGRTGFTIRRAANQTITDNTVTAINFDTENTDSDGFIAVSSTTATVPSSLGGLYQLQLVVTWSAAPNAFYMEITAAGRVFRAPGIAATSTVPGFLSLSPSDTISCNVWQSSGASRTLSEAVLVGYRLAV